MGAMRVADFTYNLPEERIAKFPPKVRGSSRLLLLDSHTGSTKHRKYSDLVDFLEAGDLVILNDTKVIKARLIALNSRGQQREILLLEDHHNTDFLRRRVLYKGKIQAGEILRVGRNEITVTQLLENGLAEISAEVNLLTLAEHVGSVPLPPYLHRTATEEDTVRYQTIFARNSGSVAAPTASLNFTDKLRDQLTNKGVRVAYLTLHVGLGTFLPIRTDELETHKMHSEYFEIPTSTARAINEAKAAGKKIIAVGTTVARTLEFAHNRLDSLKNLSGEADIFIYPGYKFKTVDALLTNFHAPKTTVLMLAAAFAGWDSLKAAYDEAIQEKYAFLSYGDSMLIV